MAKLIYSFASEQEAQQAIERLSQADLGEVRTRVLDSSETLSYPKTGDTAPSIQPGMGSLEIRPAVPPKTPDVLNQGQGRQESGSIPTTGEEPAAGGAQGVQVLIEVEDGKAAQVQEVLRQSAGSSDQ